MASPRRELVPADEDEMNGLMDEDIKALEHSRSKLRRQLGLCALVVLAGVGIVLHGSLSEAASPATLRLATWNIAAINNNPFEYWITHSDPDYNTLMADVQARPPRVRPLLILSDRTSQNRNAHPLKTHTPSSVRSLWGAP